MNKPKTAVKMLIWGVSLPERWRVWASVAAAALTRKAGPILISEAPSRTSGHVSPIWSGCWWCGSFQPCCTGARVVFFVWCGRTLGTSVMRPGSRQWGTAAWKSTLVTSTGVNVAAARCTGGLMRSQGVYFLYVCGRIRTPCNCCALTPAEVPYSETPSSYGYDPEENARGRDPLSYGGSPPSSPRLRSKSRSSRDTQSSGSLESTLSVRMLNPDVSVVSLFPCCYI